MRNAQVITGEGKCTLPEEREGRERCGVHSRLRRLTFTQAVFVSLNLFPEEPCKTCCPVQSIRDSTCYSCRGTPSTHLEIKIF